MPASMATVAATLRSMAAAPVGGPAGASGDGTEMRAAYHSTPPRISRSATAVRTGAQLMSILSGVRDGVGGIGRRAGDRLGRPGLDGDLARAVDLEREAVH